MKAEAYDPDGAKKLLAEAGYPDGFKLTIHGPTGRYINDEKIVQAVAQMLTRVGIASKVETAPMGPYSGRASKQEFSFHMVGWGASTGEASSPLRSLLATFNRDKGLGAVNRGRYSNPKVDYLVEQALQQVDDENRRAMLQQATKLAMDGPRHHAGRTSSTRSGRPRRACLHAAHRRVHARDPVQAGEVTG